MKGKNCVLFLGRWGISCINSTHIRLGEAQQIYWRKKVCQPVPRHLGNHPLLFCMIWTSYCFQLQITKSPNHLTIQLILKPYTTTPSHFIAVRKKQGIFSNFQGSSRGQTKSSVHLSTPAERCPQPASTSEEDATKEALTSIKRRWRQSFGERWDAFTSHAR